MTGKQALAVVGIYMALLALTGILVLLYYLGGMCGDGYIKVDTDNYSGCLTPQEYIDMEAQ